MWAEHDRLTAEWKAALKVKDWAEAERLAKAAYAQGNAIITHHEKKLAQARGPR